MVAAHARKRDPEATCECIRCAAQSLFAEKGYAATSTAEIARAAGVTKSLIHHHFGGKEQLWVAVLDDVFQAEQEELHAILEAGELSAEYIVESMTRIFELYRSRPEAVRMLAWQYLDLTGIDECPNKALEHGVSLISRGQEAGLVRDDVEPANALMIFLGLVEFYFQSRATKGPLMNVDLCTPEAERRYLQDAIAVFLAGVAPFPPSN